MFVKTKHIDTPEAALDRAIADYGSVRKAATALGFSATYLSFVRNGKAKWSPRLLQSLGYERVVVDRKRKVS